MVPSRLFTPKCRHKIISPTFLEDVVFSVSRQIRSAAIESIAAIRRHEKHLSDQLRSVKSTDPRLQSFIGDLPAVESTLRSLENVCQLSDVIVGERSVELLLLKDDLAQRMAALLGAPHSDPPADLSSKRVRFIEVKFRFGC